MSAKVPKQYQKQVKAASDVLGIPYQLIAEQINLESTWNPKAVSPAGAQGLTQFMPGTFKEYGPKGGDPFNPNDSLKAYVSYMQYLLKTEKGSIYKAMEAYNAGPGNLGAGNTYAHMIFLRAGVPVGAKAGKSGKNAAYDPNSGVNQAIGEAKNAVESVLDWPGEIVDFFKEAVGDLEATAKFFGAFFEPSTYVRIGAGIGGLVFLTIGVICLGIDAVKGQ